MKKIKKKLKSKRKNLKKIKKLKKIFNDNLKNCAFENFVYASDIIPGVPGG